MTKVLKTEELGYCGLGKSLVIFCMYGVKSLVELFASG